MPFYQDIIWSPADYTKAAVLAREVNRNLLARLEWMTLKPTVVIDVGCGTGEATVALRQRYPDARVFALDRTEAMLREAAAPLSICADGGQLPFKNQSVDLIFANFFFPWYRDSEPLFQEWRRVLCPNGLLMLTALGLDTLQEGRGRYHDDEIPRLIDMHDLGDQLLRSGFADPILDVDYYTVTYRDPRQLIVELHASGMWRAPDQVDLKERIWVPASKDGQWRVTYEIVYAHAFAPPSRGKQRRAADVVHVPLTELHRSV